MIGLFSKGGALTRINEVKGKNRKEKRKRRETLATSGGGDACLNLILVRYDKFFACVPTLRANTIKVSFVIATR